MKKFRIGFLALTVVFAIGSSFITRENRLLTTYYKVNSDPEGTPCLVEDVCTLSSGNNCDHTVYQFNTGTGGTCITPIALKRP